MMRVTTTNPRQGFGANLTTAALVLFASRFGLPLSTTHVSSGALFGLAAITGQARWNTIVQNRAGVGGDSPLRGRAGRIPLVDNGVLRDA